MSPVDPLREALLRAVDEPLAYWRAEKERGNETAVYYVDAFASARHNIEDALASPAAPPEPLTIENATEREVLAHFRGRCGKRIDGTADFTAIDPQATR